MTEPLTIRPSNRFLVRQRDRSWTRVLALTLLAALAVGGILALVGWPPLEVTAIHYDLLRLRVQVDELERERRALEVELQTERAPGNLARRARRMGLVPPEEAAAAEHGPAGGQR
ncbi:MAG TPA: hypothetical protein ENK19_02530 [Acidobacteria bacterium]|nr:hypothetical protein [Acidobacteriota bacterium]